MKLVAVMLFSTGMSAQSLQILASPPARESATFRIMLVSPESKAPVALQWKLSLPEGVKLKEVFVGDAAETAHKSIVCSDAHAENKGAGPEYRCLVVGGQSAFPDGAVALVKCSVRSGLREAVVRIQNAIGVSRDSKEITIPDTQGTIAVQ